MDTLAFADADTIPLDLDAFRLRTRYLRSTYVNYAINLSSLVRHAHTSRLGSTFSVLAVPLRSNLGIYIGSVVAVIVCVLGHGHGHDSNEVQRESSCVLLTSKQE
jgi:hypothetical protein